MQQLSFDDSYHAVFVSWVFIMNIVVAELEQKRKQLLQEQAAVQIQVNDLNTRISQKRVQLKNFQRYYPDNTVSINSAFQSMKLMQVQIATKEGRLRALKSGIHDIDNKISGIVKGEIREERKETRNERKEVSKDTAVAGSAQGGVTAAKSGRFSGIGRHLKNLHGTAKSHGFNLLFVLLILSAIYIDWSGWTGNTFGTIPTPLFQLSGLAVIQLVFILWFFIDSEQNMLDTAMLVGFFLVNLLMTPLTLPVIGVQIPYIPVMLFLVLLKWQTVGTQVTFRSVKLVAMPVIVLYLLAFIVAPLITSYLPASLGIMDLGSHDGQSADDGSSASGSSSSLSDIFCKIYPLSCTAAAEEQDNVDDSNDISYNGAEIKNTPALATPSKSVSKLSDPGFPDDFDWSLKNEGKTPIDTALFLMNGSQIDGNYSGKIKGLDQDYSNSGKIEYPGVFIPSELFYYPYPYIAGSREKSMTVNIDVPRCSLGKFEAPVFVMYKYMVDSGLMLTFGSNDWWTNLEDQGLKPKLSPTKSVSTAGPFSLSIYPNENEQPLLIRESERFVLNFELSNNGAGRAAISSFDIFISNKLIPQGLGDTCELVRSSSGSSDSSMNSYVLKSQLFDNIDSVDLSVDDGFKGSEVYRCSFVYDPDSFENDFKGGSTQKYIRALVSYTYIYNGMFTLNTKNSTNYDVC